VVEQTRRQLAEVQARLDRARKAALEDAALDSPEALASAAQANLALLTNLRRDFVDAESEVAEYTARETEGGPRRLAAARARSSVLAKRVADVERAQAQTTAALARRTARRDEVQTEVRSAQAAFETASARLRDAQAAAGNRTERLRIIDPGIIPQRPSSPNLILNVIAAFLLAAVAALVYLTVRFGLRERPVPRLRASASRGGLSA
jgi:capsule polysaccharide export protein KpsE/RkpR